MKGMDSYLVLSTESEAYILGSVVNDGWYRLGEDGRPLGRALSYQEIDRHWVSLDYSRSWEDARRSLERRQLAISRIDSRRHRSTGSLKICFVPTISFGTFMGFRTHPMLIIQIFYYRMSVPSFSFYSEI